MQIRSPNTEILRIQAIARTSSITHVWSYHFIPIAISYELILISRRIISLPVFEYHALAADLLYLRYMIHPCAHHTISSISIPQKIPILHRPSVLEHGERTTFVSVAKTTLESPSKSSFSCTRCRRREALFCVAFHGGTAENAYASLENNMCNQTDAPVEWRSNFFCCVMPTQ